MHTPVADGSEYEGYTAIQHVEQISPQEIYVHTIEDIYMQEVNSSRKSTPPGSQLLQDVRICISSRLVTFIFAGDCGPRVPFGRKLSAG